MIIKLHIYKFYKTNLVTSKLFCRSSSDDYCPQDQVEAIQASLISMLLDVYKDIEIKKLYEVSLAEHS